MIPDVEQKQIISLIKREVVPAIGCTEPAAVSLCVAKATELLGCLPEKITVLLSANVLKNAMGVGIPGTGMIGLPIAVALGAIVGRSEYELEVLRDTTPQSVKQGQEYIAQKRINILLKEGITEKLYIEAVCEASGSCAKASIASGHTNFVRLEKDGCVTLDKAYGSSAEGEGEKCQLSLRKVFDFATTTPIESLKFILEAERLNSAVADISLKERFGHCVGVTVAEPKSASLLGNNILSHIVSYTSAACDARMAGAPYAVMSNSGSGNQGIATTLPVVVYARETGASEEQKTRALILSHLTAIYIKQSLGRLSALCGCVVASTGSSCGITYLMGGKYENVAFAVKNMVATLTGMICDGAKPSCALKLSSGVSTAVLSAMMAMDAHYVTGVEGIIDEDVDKSIENMTLIGRDGMNITDSIILDIMTHKC